MSVLLVLALTVLTVATVQADQCPYGAYTSCGFWGWGRCYTTKYKYCLHGGWSGWTEASRTTCSKSCESGTQTVYYTRTCTNPAPYNGGNYCSGSSSTSGVATCNTHRCPIHGGWTAFTESSRTSCSKSCGTGTLNVTKTRSCTNPTPRYGGNNCSGSSTTTATETCNVQPCPIDGGWSVWNDWQSLTKCTVMCGGGVINQTRDRACDNPIPRYGGRDCVGKSRQNRTTSCGNQPCGDLCPEGNNTYLRADSDKYFYQCQQGQNNSINTRAILMKCPPKMVWDQDEKTCVLKAEPTIAPACVGFSTRVDPSDCQFYFQCAGGTEVRMPCPPGTKFYQVLNQCILASSLDSC